MESVTRIPQNPPQKPHQTIRKAFASTNAHGKAVMTGAANSSAVYKSIRHPSQDYRIFVPMVQRKICSNMNATSFHKVDPLSLPTYGLNVLHGHSLAQLRLRTLF
jgi:hypothetical protein